EELTGISGAGPVEAQLPPGKRTVVEQLDVNTLHAHDPPAAQSHRDPLASVPWPQRRDALDDYRIAGLRGVLAHVPDRTLRATTLAAADPAIARGVPGEPARTTNASGRAIWRA